MHELWSSSCSFVLGSRVTLKSHFKCLFLWLQLLKSLWFSDFRQLVLTKTASNLKLIVLVIWTFVLLKDTSLNMCLLLEIMLNIFTADWTASWTSSAKGSVSIQPPSSCTFLAVTTSSPSWSPIPWCTTERHNSNNPKRDIFLSLSTTNFSKAAW